MSYSEAMKRLEEIVASLEAGGTDLEETPVKKNSLKQKEKSRNYVWRMLSESKTRGPTKKDCTPSCRVERPP